MTFTAGNILVFSNQWEGRPVMIEPSGSPVKRIVAPLAVGATALLKLPVVDILVATFTACRQLREFLVYPASLAGFEMAGSACLCEMGPFQDEIRFRMVKINFTPPVVRVATLTAGFPVIFFIQVRLMDILVTIHAGLADIPETPFVFLLVTGKAGRGQVRAAELKSRLIMHLDGVVRPVKAKGGMAAGAILPAAFPDKLAFMVICVAVVAMLIPDGPGIPAFMTAGTGHILVFSHQGIVGPGMVEVIQLLDPVEGYFRMALGALLAEFIIVHILVAGSAVCKGNTGKLLHFLTVMISHLMTLNAFDPGMLPE
jgi:hypothetical protein